MKTLEEIKVIYKQPLLNLIAKASVIRNEHPQIHIQLCSLISIKTGGCPEDCKYCAQSSHYQTDVKPSPLMSLEDVMRQAKIAIAQGATRICLGAAWREVRDNKQFDRVLEMIKAIRALGVEVCCTLGMLTEEQAQKLVEAGLYAYNHNLDTSEDYYSKIITSRTYADRLRTLDIIEKTNLQICCGGIIGLGETVLDRLKLLQVLASRTRPPESVPINLLVPIQGTPMENQPIVSFWELLRLVATAKIVLPKSMIRLAAGRLSLSNEQQTLCFVAGAQSIFLGEKLLTVGNPSVDQDQEFISALEHETFFD